MNILVTGGAGYIGSHTCVELLESGYGVIVIDNLCNSSPKSLERVQALTGKSLTFYEGDVRDEALLRKIFAQHEISCVIHFAGLKADIAGKTIGIPKEYFGEGVDEAVSETVKNAIAKLEELGAKTVEVSLPSMKYALAAYYVTCTCEASSNLDRFDGVRYGEIAPDTNMPWHDAYTKVRTAGFGDEVRRRIILGTFALSAGYYGKYYVKARYARQQIAKDFAKALKAMQSPNIKISADSDTVKVIKVQETGEVLKPVSNLPPIVEKIFASELHRTHKTEVQKFTLDNERHYVPFQYR